MFSNVVDSRSLVLEGRLLHLMAKYNIGLHLTVPVMEHSLAPLVGSLMLQSLRSRDMMTPNPSYEGHWKPCARHPMAFDFQGGWNVPIHSANMSKS
jgi:hypothetical protein